MSFYDSSAIKKTGATIKMVFGKRSAGKTFDRLIDILRYYWDAKQNGMIWQAAYIRRRKEDLKTSIMNTVWDTIICDANGKNRVEEITDGEFDNVLYYQGSWRLSKKDPNTGLVKKDNLPLMIAISLSTWGHSKGGAFPHVKMIWFEEFMAVPEEPYLPGEFSAFQQVLSTITRNRIDVELWLTGNSIDLYCPYFENLGINHVEDIKPGHIQLYKLGKTDRKIAVEYTDTKLGTSDVNKGYLFAFDTQDSDLITSGNWQTGLYPLLDCEIKVSSICGRFFIKFKGKVIQADIISDSGWGFIYIHSDLDPLAPIDEENDLIFSREFSPKPNYRRDMKKPMTVPEKLIGQLFNQEKVFYDNNVTGFIVASFQKDCV